MASFPGYISQINFYRKILPKVTSTLTSTVEVTLGIYLRMWVYSSRSINCLHALTDSVQNLISASGYLSRITSPAASTVLPVV